MVRGKRALLAAACGLAVGVMVANGSPVGRSRPADPAAAKARLDVLRDAGQWSLERIQATSGFIDDGVRLNQLQLQRDRLEAAVVFFGDSAELVAELEQIDRAAGWLEVLFVQREEAGVVAKESCYQVQAHRRWVKLQLAEARARQK